jgi:tRNA pseudouridine32 synthase/23S rRNA pseudouridine746 synthase
MPRDAGARPARSGVAVSAYRRPGPHAPSLTPLTPYHPPHGPLRLLHRDAALLVVEKPAGLLAVPGKPAGAEDCLLARLAAADGAVRLVHRLDRDTSGVMVFARSPAAQRHLGLQFERRHVAKRYVALVAGRPAAAGGVIDLPLAADWPRRPLQKVCRATGKPARTGWEVLPPLPGQPAGATRVALRPETGRSHQLRVHMLALGHPILGDPLYAPESPLPRLMLHAERLALRHPEGGVELTFLSPAPF